MSVEFCGANRVGIRGYAGGTLPRKQNPETKACLCYGLMGVRMNHESFMREALAEAHKALEKGEIPVGAVVVLDGQIIGRGHNQRETASDPTAHAEIVALRMAGKNRCGWRLTGATLYVTLEPCPMCAGALVQSRIARVVYGADDPKAGCAGTLLNLLQFPGFNHEVKITGGVLAEEAAGLLQEFFKMRR